MAKTEAEKTRMSAWVQICGVNMFTHKRKLAVEIKILFLPKLDL